MLNPLVIAIRCMFVKGESVGFRADKEPHPFVNWNPYVAGEKKLSV